MSRLTPPRLDFSSKPALFSYSPRLVYGVVTTAWELRSIIVFFSETCRANLVNFRRSPQAPRQFKQNFLCVLSGLVFLNLTGLSDLNMYPSSHRASRIAGVWQHHLLSFFPASSLQKRFPPRCSWISSSHSFLSFHLCPIFYLYVPLPSPYPPSFLPPSPFPWVWFSLLVYFLSFFLFLFQCLFCLKICLNR